MNTRHAFIFTAAVFAASCINYTGLEGDGSEYTKPSALTSGGESGADAGGGSCTPECPSTCRTTSVGDGCSDTCPANCATSCSGGVCQAATTPDAGRSDGGGATGDASTATEAGACQADGLTTCESSTCDDGTNSATSLGASSLDCLLDMSPRDWAATMSHCAELGAGWRLASKGEALKIASSPNVCRTPLSGGWTTWTRTCVGAGMAWDVSIGGGTGRSRVAGLLNALCVR